MAKLNHVVGSAIYVLKLIFLLKNSYKLWLYDRRSVMLIPNLLLMQFLPDPEFHGVYVLETKLQLSARRCAYETTSLNSASRSCFIDCVRLFWGKLNYRRLHHTGRDFMNCKKNAKFCCLTYKPTRMLEFLR